MMKEITEAQKAWEKAKHKAYRDKQEANELEYARKLSECRMFKGTETLEEVTGLMFSPQGTEFLTKFGFPDLATFRKFKKYHPERYGVYIDCGRISLSEARKVFLVGNSSATLDYRETAGSRIILMHGARAVITASGYSVVKIEHDALSNVKYEAGDHAKVLI